jgi:hypothetical protein
MAQGFTDFTGNTVGATPPTDWVERWAATAFWNTGTGPAIERALADTGYYDALCWEVPGSVVGNKEIVVRIRTSDTGGQPIGAVMDASASGISGYFLTLAFGTELVLARMDSGTETSIGAGSYTFAHVADTDYWLRFGRNGNDIRGQVWAASGSDPGGWLFTVTDSTYTTGRMGVYARASFPTVRCTAAGYGTAGDAAPLSGGGGGGADLVVPSAPAQRNRRKSGRFL